MSQRGERKRQQRFLEGGPFLVVVGFGLIALATWHETRSSVATVFAVMGVASVILGVVLERVEGAFELGPGGLKATLRAARSIEEREDLTLAEKGDELLYLLSGARGAPAHRPVQSPLAGRLTTQPGLGSPPSPQLPSPGLFVVTSESRAQASLDFQRHVAQAFRSAGWHVEEPDGPGDMGVDLKARLGGRLVCVEVKLYRAPLSAADAREFLGLAHLAPCGADAEYVLAVREGSLTRAALDALRSSPRITLLEVPVVWDEEEQGAGR